jgi:hypothetical protein
MMTIYIFPKTLRFFTISFNQANDVNVTLYETAHTNIHVNFGNVLGVAFSIPSGSLSLVKYSVCHAISKFSLDQNYLDM